tara:strand:- start:102 stop:647 length:546 start_codon:yes stop_codon:yes gene_type:complete
MRKSVKVASAIDIKNVVQGRGHDCGGLICDVYFNKKKVATFHDDGWGGEPEYHFLVDGAKEEIEAYFKSINLAQVVYDELIAEGYTFFKSVDKVTFDWLFQSSVEKLATQKGIDKDCKKAICFGTPNYYQMYQFKKVSKLEDILKFSNGLEVLQKAYDEAKTQKGEVLNSDEQLIALGVKL